MEENFKKEVISSLSLPDLRFDPSGNLLNDGNIVASYVCLRPGNNQGVPKIISHEESGKIVTSTYGHGGVGWSLLWGSVYLSIKHFEELNKGRYSKDEKIVVVGAGAIGRGMAIALNDLGYTNVVILTDKLDDLTSHRSGAFFSVSSVNSLFEIEDKIKKIYEDNIEISFKIWGKIIDEKKLGIQKGVKRLKCYIGAEKEVGPIETDSGLEEVVLKGLIPPPELVEIVCNGKTSHKMKKYDTYYFNTNVLMDELLRIITEKNIPIQFGKITSFGDGILQGFNVVFNCTGLDNRNIMKDKDIHPIAGHIITINNQDIENLDYVVYSHYILPEEVEKYRNKKHDAPLYYFMPKNYNSIRGLLGGSFCFDYEDGDNSLNQENFKGILRRTEHFFGLNLELEKKLTLTSKF